MLTMVIKITPSLLSNRPASAGLFAAAFSEKEDIF